MKALVRVKKVYRPVSREFQGFRLQACIPNNNARLMLPDREGDFKVTNRMVPSFAGKFLIKESMDYSAVQDLTQAELERFYERLRWEGFTEFEPVGKNEDFQHLFGKQTSAAPPAIETRVAEILKNLPDAPF